VSGVVFKRKIKMLEGPDAIPNIEFWRDLPNLVQDGLRFTIKKVRILSLRVKERLNKNKTYDEL
jgi:hypothetical protein